ncbi:hypothetical protein BG015_008717, partial [Linnemannia schmuckeri]
MSTSTNSALFGPDSSSSCEAASSSVFEATQRVHYSTSPTSSSFSSYRPQHSRQNSRDPAFYSENNANGSTFLPSLVSDPSSHNNQPQSRSSSFSSTTSASSSSTSYSERHDHHHPHFYHEQPKTSEPAAYGYQRNHSQHIYQAHVNNSNNNNDAQSPSSHLLPQLPAEPFALYSLNQHQHYNNSHQQQQPHRDTSLPQLMSSSPRQASKNGDGVFGGNMPDHDDHQGISFGSSSQPIHSRQSSSASATAAAAASVTIAHLHLHDHPPTSTSSSSSSPPTFNSSSNHNTAATSSLFQSRHSPPSPHSPSLLFPSSSSSHHHHPLSSSASNSSSAFLGPASSSSSSRSPQTPPLTPSPRKHDSSPPLQGHHPHHQHYQGQQQRHPAGGVGHRRTTSIGVGVRGVRGVLGPVSSAAHAEKAMHKVLTHEPGCVKSRRLAHILSEQKRREKINGGFDELKSVIP